MPGTPLAAPAGTHLMVHKNAVDDAQTFYIPYPRKFDSRFMQSEKNKEPESRNTTYF